MANEKLGLIGKKLGMIQIYDDAGTVHGVTVVEVAPNTILQVKTTAGKDGYNALQLGAGEGKKKQAARSNVIRAEKLGVALPRYIREFRVTAAAAASAAAGGQLSIGDLFKVGDLVDVQGQSKGKGFKGVMVRHNFAGFGSSHGVHEYYRHGGSIGTRLTPGMTMKGTKMPGHMGDRKVSVQNIKIVKIDAERNLVFLKGGVPGPRGARVALRPAVKG
ncbi:MAG: 50S ribosomal protein L3 [Deltaproteobacteria bacterium]|nr:50S ribosomal protein L3 [Deltaproteobacteria bacterium]